MAPLDLSHLTVDDFFKYHPSAALASVALALFLIAAAVVAFQTERSKFRFMHTVSVTGLCMAAGYAAVLFCITQSGKANLFGAFVAKQMFLLLSPNLLQATTYLTVGHVLAASPDITKGRALLGKKAITIIFAGADVFALVIQGIGMSIYATALTSGNGTEQSVKLGSVIVLVGLAGQLLFFVAFIALAAWVHRHPGNCLAGTRALCLLILGLYLNIAFLTLRNMYRFVEFCQTTILGYPQPAGAYILEDKEVLFYCLDTVPILICFAAFIALHPGWFLPAASSQPAPQKQKQFAVVTV